MLFMKNKNLFFLVIIVLFAFFLSQKSNSEPNYSYKIYTPHNFSEVSKNVENARN